MALLQDLIQQIDDPALKERILQETNKLLKQKKFGLLVRGNFPGFLYSDDHLCNQSDRCHSRQILANRGVYYLLLCKECVS